MLWFNDLRVIVSSVVENLHPTCAGFGHLDTVVTSTILARHQISQLG